jgi:dTDP-4-dehydrorhamnose 3,5-epimerase
MTTERWQAQAMRGVFLYMPFCHTDDRGEFVKPFHAPTCEQAGRKFSLREEFFSVSHQNVLRGMHLQTSPHAHQKIVYCISGSILDVLVDLRPDEPTFGKTASFELNAANRSVLWIPTGIAHGFLSREENSCVVYKTDVEHFPQSDSGVRWDSIDFDWGVTAPIVSARDQSLPTIDEFLAREQVL